jgi:chemotaxis response regulator CheB
MNSAEEGAKHMTQPIRVVVANRPRLMRELVLETIIGQPDIEIVAEIQNESEISQIVEGTHPDFLIIALDESNQRPALCDTLLRRYPEMKILALAPERNSSIYYWASFDIHSSEVEASEEGLLSTLRRKNQYVGG